MKLFKTFIIESKINIKTTSDKVWDFFYHLDVNYKKWYPEEHHYFKWIKGKPLDPGTKFDSLEIVDGHKTRVKGTCLEAVKNEKFAFKPSWPTSFMCTKLEWKIENNDNSITFIAKVYYKFGRIFLALKKKTVNDIMAITKKHMDKEGINLKTLLESNK